MHWGLGERHAFLDEAKSLAKLGVASLLIDAPFVRRGNQLSEAADLRQCVIDVRRGLDFLAKRRRIDTTRIAFVGLSYGAHVGALLLAEEPRFRAFVLMGAFASNADAMRKLPLPTGVTREQMDHDLSEIEPLDAGRFVKQP